jgi:2-polyprenyl-6-methoxyphenol hydroxylase-like FAD-dependent oxidoreductase
VRIDGIGFSAVGRLELLRLLRERAQGVGVRIEYEYPVESLAELRNADLIVGADGVHSLVRNTYAKDFGASVTYLTNRFAWYGTTRRFETLTQTFRRTPHGSFNAHHYRYSPRMSTFIVETDEATWQRAGFDSMDPEATRHHLERVFADSLDGHPLISNKSTWRQFPQVRNERWSAANATLLGDALHTAHFSIGSGTRLAMEDAIALAGAIADGTGIREATLAYEHRRRPILDKIVAAADASAGWYERFAAHMASPPLEFAMSYIMRSGRVDLERLRRASPRFVEAYQAHVQSAR